MFEYRVEVRVHWMIVKLFRLNFWNIVACMVNMLMIMFYLQLKVWRDRCPNVAQIPANFPLYVEILTQRLMIVKLVVTNTLCGLVRMVVVQTSNKHLEPTLLDMLFISVVSTSFLITFLLPQSWLPTIERVKTALIQAV